MNSTSNEEKVVYKQLLLKHRYFSELTKLNDTKISELTNRIELFKKMMSLYNTQNIVCVDVELSVQKDIDNSSEKLLRIKLENIQLLSEIKNIEKERDSMNLVDINFDEMY